MFPKPNDPLPPAVPTDRMYEVERKVRAAHTDLRDSLADIDVEYIGTVEQRDQYFNHPNRDFASTDEALRVRRQRVQDGSLTANDQVTYKGPRLDAATKTRIERETGLETPEELIAILEALDFTPAGQVNKTREQYRSASCTICLDTVDQLGEFVEIEADSDADSIDVAENATMHLSDKLGIATQETIDASYLGMILGQNESA